MKRVESLNIDSKDISISPVHDDDLDMEEYCCKNNPYFRLKVDTLTRLLKVVSAFPFVIVISSLNLNASHSFVR